MAKDLILEGKEDEITKLDKVGLETLAALLNNNTLTAAAEALTISRQALYDRIEKYNLNAVLEAIPQQAVNSLMQGSVKAADNLVRKVDSTNDEVSIKASTEILDRVGLAKAKSDSGTTVNNFGTIVNEMKDKYAG